MERLGGQFLALSYVPYLYKGVPFDTPGMGVTSLLTRITVLILRIMSQKIKFITSFLVLWILLTGTSLLAQTPLDMSNPASINVSSLNDSQIQTLLQQASAQGMSLDQAIQIAKARGASQAQIDDLMKRVNGAKKNTDQPNKKKEFDETLDKYASEYSQKEEVILSEKINRIYGHQLFNSKKLSFEPSMNIPLSNDYVLGVNDELTINVSGASQQTYQLTIDRNGSIFIPNIGPVPLLGMQFDEARKLIKKRLNNIFHGMSGSTPNTWADVSISNLHSIKVNVVGEAMVPGTYTLPASASAFNALYISGGPNENGSFRNIRVIRDNKVIKTIDVYDYLLNSDASSNISLRDQDVINISTYESRVDLTGSFIRPGLYELKKGETMENLMAYSGGFSSEAFKGSVSVMRLNGVQRSMLDVKTTDFSTFAPESGDAIVAGKGLDRYENRVNITGAVFRPGDYALTPGMKLSNLIALAQGLREDAFSNRGLIFRVGPDLTPTSKAFDVDQVLKGINDVELQREDYVLIQDKSTLREKRFVRIYGEVQKEGEYDYNENMTIRDLIFQAGGLLESASESFIEISRRHDYETASKVSDKMVDLFTLNVSRDLKVQESDKRFLLKPYDYIYVRKAPSYFEQKNVTIEGEVLYPGPYSIQSKDERISDLLKRCGGLSSHAYVDGATLFRKLDEKEQIDTTLISELANDSLDTKTTKQLFNGRVELQLGKILKNPKSIFNYHLKDGDRIVIPEISEEVRVAGEILNPVGLAYEARRNAKYYIDRSGGFSENARKSKVFVVNSDGTTKVTQSFLFNVYPPVGPGAKIIVPAKDVKARVEPSMWLAIASTFSSIAVAIAAILP
jgi:protein involved in polysaccharide export with SLBB domain